jgi:hypothetical protein
MKSSGDTISKAGRANGVGWRVRGVCGVCGGRGTESMVRRYLAKGVRATGVEVSGRTGDRSVASEERCGIGEGTTAATSVGDGGVKFGSDANELMRGSLDKSGESMGGGAV